MSALAKLEQLQGEVGAQRTRVAELDRARHDRARKVQEARERLLDFYRTAEAQASVTDLALGGEAIIVETGSPTEDDLLEAVREAESGLSLRTITYPLGEGMSDVRLEPADEVAEARYQGAQEALQAAEERLQAFAASYFGDLQVERAPRAGEAQRSMESALAACRAAAADFERERTWQVSLLKAAGRDDLIADLPSNPGAWLADAPRQVPAPMPQSLSA